MLVHLHLGIISFNGCKIITTGGGGVVITNNKKLYEKVKHLSTTAKVFRKYEFIHDQVDLIIERII